MQVDHASKGPLEIPPQKVNWSNRVLHVGWPYHESLAFNRPMDAPVCRTPELSLYFGRVLIVKEAENSELSRNPKVTLENSHTRLQASCRCALMTGSSDLTCRVMGSISSTYFRYAAEYTGFAAGDTSVRLAVLLRDPGNGGAKELYPP